MTFIITLFALIIERFFHWRHMRHLGWFNSYQRWLSTTRISNWPSYVLLALAVLPPVIIVALVNGMLSGLFYGFFKILFCIAVMMYCLGPDNLWLQAYASINDLHADDQAAAIQRVNAAFNIGNPENSQAFHQAFARGIFLAAYCRIFAVIFWFVILGPAGAVLYRLIAHVSYDSSLGLTKNSELVRRILDWIPIRIFTFLFALSGHFTHVFHCWKSKVMTGHGANECILCDCGIAALDMSNDGHLPEDGSAEKEAVSLLDRTFVMSLVLLAVIVLMV